MVVDGKGRRSTMVARGGFGPDVQLRLLNPPVGHRTIRDRTSEEELFVSGRGQVVSRM